MPPSREFKLVFDEDWIAALCAHLHISIPYTIKLDIRGQNKTMGQIDYGKRVIKLYLGINWYAGTRLTFVKNEILVTLLHEFRHAHQQENWSAKELEADASLPYGLKRTEKDAEQWANANRENWRGLFAIKPVSGSKLGRLSAAEGRARA